MRGLKVLVADDFENSRQSIRKILLSVGIDNIHLTATGKGVLDECKSKKFDLILCDYNLGHGKNGQQVLEEVRDLGYLKSTALFIIISAETSRDVVMGIMEAGPDDYLTKPFTQSVLVKRIERLVLQNGELSKVKIAQAEKNYPVVLTLCNQLIKDGSRYSAWCRRRMAEAFFEVKQYSKTKSLCKLVQSKRDLDWAMVLEARVMREEASLSDAISHLNQVIAQFPNCIKAFDLLAQYLEEEGDSEQAQDFLESAVELSPRVMSRQQSLVNLSLANGNLDVALKSSQHALKLSANSLYASADQFLQAAQVLSESVIGDTSPEGRKKAQEAFTILNQMTKKYPDDTSTHLNKILIESQLLSGQGKTNQANLAFKEAQSIIEDQKELLTPEIALEMGKVLYARGQHESATQMFNQILHNDNVDDQLIAKTYAFLDEPVGLSARLKAKQDNLVGLSFYESQRYEDAIEAFKKAQKSSPIHPGLNMNLVQTALKLMETTEQKQELVNLCLDSLDRIKHITSKHKQYKRYRSLKSYVTRHFQSH
ncbi:Response regulator receiver domain protein (CheY) [Marinomonas sp. MED121]|uniref:tetratricopeptide repeat-containing response regulator n=1 Tax=Marinomonas sp. MED121 TaxID=314277 RepID=UPI0000690821|nr:tetratricopeptide repeat-containing response regulator [Marinomonas sp. MED121]EAQ64592.1 Response regulator receiver domain protein (CheY) [Marinomonas sp. MED121]